MAVFQMNEQGADGQAVLHVEGELTVPGAVEMKGALLGALDGGRDIRIDLDEVTGIDLTALQLLCGARKFSVKNGVSFSLKSPLPERVREISELLGYSCRVCGSLDPARSCLFAGKS